MTTERILAPLDRSAVAAVLRGTTTPILLRRAAEAPIQTPNGTGQTRPVKEKSNV